MKLKIMVFDVETNGLPLWQEPSVHPGQPHIVEYSAMLADAETHQELGFDYLMIRPEGWTIPPELTKIHGISEERALAEGVPERLAVNAYMAMVQKADRICAFGIDFDTRIMRIAMLRCGMTKEHVNELTASKTRVCLMRQATPLCKLPPTEKMMAAGRKKWKTPTLTEAVKELLGEDLEGAHDSRVDVLATMRVFWHLNG